MRYLSDSIKTQIINYVDEYYASNGYTPTIAIIAKRLQLSEGAIHKYLHRMTQLDELLYDGRHILTPRIESAQSKACAQISGQIACGDPIIAQHEYGDSVLLPASLIGKGSFFILRAKGDSMVNIGIFAGDLVIIKQQNYADEGQVVAVLVDGENATLKRYTLDHKNKKVVLLPENDKYRPIIKSEDEIRIMGILVYAMKDMRGI